MDVAYTSFYLGLHSHVVYLPSHVQVRMCCKRSVQSGLRDSFCKLSFIIWLKQAA
jgi:hypothetical protein